MKVLMTLMLITSALVLNGCVMAKPNPEFRSCANACTEKQDECMVKAAMASDIPKCNNALSSCITICEQKHSRYLQPFAQTR